MTRFLLMLFLFVTGAGGGYFYVSHARAATAVKTVLPVREAIESRLRVTGTVMNDRVVKLAALINGEIKALNVNIGDHVAKGQLLVTFDDARDRRLIRRAEATLKMEQQSLALAQKQLQRLQKLKRSGSVSAEVLETGQTRVGLGFSRVAIAEENLALAKLDLRNTRVYAPYAGTIIDKLADSGQWTEAATPLLVLASDHGREIEAHIDAGDFAAIKPGASVQLQADAWPGKSWRETILRIAPSVSNDKQETLNTFAVRISLGSAAPPLLLNQQVDIHLVEARQDNALTIPLSALREEDDVFRVMGMVDGKVRYLPVQTGVESYTRVEITSGIDENTAVILPEGKTFSEGEPVIAERADEHDPA